MRSLLSATPTAALRGRISASPCWLARRGESRSGPGPVSSCATLEGLEAFKKPDHDRTSLHDAQRVSLRLHPRRHHIENPFCRLDDLAYIGLRRDKTRRG